jgi:serine/threonine-protein kinase RsbW
MTLELQATPEEVMRAVEALREFGQASKVPEKTLFGLTVALEECGSNIVNHAYRHDPRQKFRVNIEPSADMLIIELRDRGPEFDPTKASVPGPAPADDERPPGNWGLQLVRRYVDEIRYRREAGENVLRLIKKLAPEPTPESTINH